MRSWRYPSGRIRYRPIKKIRSRTVQRLKAKGTHPRNYKEKYKELQPEKYPETIEKVIQKGGTPVGMHLSICVNEILEFLQIKPGQKGLDATLGYGGHLKILRWSSDSPTIAVRENGRQSFEDYIREQVAACSRSSVVPDHTLCWSSGVRRQEQNLSTLILE